jgi:hypothetical protein
MRLNRLLWVVIGCISLAAGDACLAQSPYELESRREWILLGGGAALGVSAAIIIENVDPLTIAEIDQLDPDDVNRFDRPAIKPYRETRAGDALMYASYALPLTLLFRQDTGPDWKRLGVMWGQVTLINLGLNGVLKGLTLRTRPYAYDPETPLEEKTTATARMSFYSGHTSSAAANCFFVAKVLNDHLTNKRAKAFVWAGAAVYPALTAYLRRDSGHHFRTDVITGYCMGALVGYIVPWLHRSGVGKHVTLYPTAARGTAGVAVDIAF